MTYEQAQVLKFMLACRMKKVPQLIGDWPGVRDAQLRTKLVFEEAMEFVTACGFELAPGNAPFTLRPSNAEPDLVAAIDAMCDLLYVVYGAAIAFGIDLDPFFAEVHNTNMAKVTGEIVLRGDGKLLKPEGWKPPDLARVLKDVIAARANG